MRILILLRGAMGSGKSTFVSTNNLENYTLCPDKIRLLFQSPIMTPKGKLAISQKNDGKVWKFLFQLLEERMQRGELTVIDAVHAKSSDFGKYKDLAQTYRYRVYCVDFTDVPIEQAKAWNLKRPEFKQVPEDVIDNAYSRFSTFSPQGWVTTIKPAEMITILNSFPPLDLSNYKKIHHIGDIHGCFEPLQAYFKDGLKDDEFYIFVGDFTDRGKQNTEVLNFIFSIMERKNVLLLEGNHEKHVWDWSCNNVSKSNEFECVTKRELERNNVDKKQARIFYRKLIQVAYYMHHGKYVLVTHGGVSNFLNDDGDILQALDGRNKLRYVASNEFSHGVGRYEDSKTCDDAFLTNTQGMIYSIHGHRNVEGSDCQVNDVCYNLEGKVEFGGDLRIVTIEKDQKPTIILIKNTIISDAIPKHSNNNNELPKEKAQIATIINEMRKSGLINERKEGNISSFNFKRDVFYNKLWDTSTTRARGLFINVDTNEIVSRSYDKFFNIGERYETKIEQLQHSMKFPATAYVKENGFLGLVGYDSQSDKLIVSSKSTTLGDFSVLFSNMFYEHLNNIEKEKRLHNEKMTGLRFIEIENGIKAFLKEENVSMVFEAIDPEEDPHIIEYKEKGIILLDCVKRDLSKFERLPEDKLKDFATKYEFKVKDKAQVFENWQEFFKWYQDIQIDGYLFNGEQIEGFVIEDANNFMIKVKLPYYNSWKKLRSIKDALERGKASYLNQRHIQASMNTPLINSFFGWLKTLPKEELTKDIIALRKMYEKKIEAEETSSASK